MKNNRFSYPSYAYSKSAGYCRISAIETYFPETVVSNEEIIHKHALKVNPKVIAETVGVTTRHIADLSATDSELMGLASKKAFTASEIEPQNLDKIIVNKFFGDKILPMTASFLQSNLQLKKAIHSFDIDGGLSAYFQSLDFAARMPIMPESPVLIASGGICNRLVSKNDSRHAFLFGDGACATILSSAEKRHIRASYQVTNTAFAHLSRSMSFTERPHIDTFENDQPFFYDLYAMENWSEAVSFVSESSAHALQTIMEHEAISKQDIDGIVLGCFNKKMEEAVIHGLNIPTRNVFSGLSKYGNTMSASLPTSIHEALKSGVFSEGSTLLFVSVGEGITMGCMLYEI